MDRKSCNFTKILSSPPDLITLSRAVHGQSVIREGFLLPDYWMLHFYDYRGRLRIGDSEFVIEPGSASIAPANENVVFEYEGISKHLYAHFRVKSRGAVTPQFWLPEPRVDALRNHLEAALYFRDTDPRRADARLWDVLLGLDTLKRQPDMVSSDEQVIEAGIRRIEAGIAGPLRIAEIARDIGISSNTLTRVFRRRLKLSPVAYLRKCRINRALDLLLHSDLPVKAIACSVGLPDLQHFNKVIRKETGRGPRAWR